MKPRDIIKSELKGGASVGDTCSKAASGEMPSFYKSQTTHSAQSKSSTNVKAEAKIHKST